MDGEHVHSGDFSQELGLQGGFTVGRVLFNLPDEVCLWDRDKQETWIKEQADGVARTAARMMKERLNLD